MDVARRQHPALTTRTPPGRSSLSGVTDAIDRLDDRLDEAWDALRGHPAIDRLFYTASEAADFSVLWHTLGVAQTSFRLDCEQPASVFYLWLVSIFQKHSRNLGTSLKLFHAVVHPTFSLPKSANTMSNMHLGAFDS